MPFDFVASPARQSRKARGLTNYLAGHAAEASVARHYEDRGIAICARNWRGITGEIDLIGRCGDDVIFVEVKKSRSHDLAGAQDHELLKKRIVRAGFGVEGRIGGEEEAPAATGKQRWQPSVGHGVRRSRPTLPTISLCSRAR